MVYFTSRLEVLPKPVRTQTYNHLGRNRCVVIVGPVSHQNPNLAKRTLGAELTCRSISRRAIGGLAP